MIARILALTALVGFGFNALATVECGGYRYVNDTQTETWPKNSNGKDLVVPMSDYRKPDSKGAAWLGYIVIPPAGAGEVRTMDIPATAQVMDVFKATQGSVLIAVGIGKKGDTDTISMGRINAPADVYGVISGNGKEIVSTAAHLKNNMNLTGLGVGLFCFEL